jgi:hypothetical protein
MLSDWLPKSALALRAYSAKKLSADLISGITHKCASRPADLAS